MTRLLKFYGASDDLFEIQGGARNEPDEIDPSSVVMVVSGFEMEEGLIVSAHYAPGRAPCWAIGISQLDEDKTLPNWPMRFTAGEPARGYSVVLEIEAPDDAMMTEIPSKW